MSNEADNQDTNNIQDVVIEPRIRNNDNTDERMQQRRRLSTVEPTSMETSNRDHRVNPII